VLEDLGLRYQHTLHVLMKETLPCPIEKVAEQAAMTAAIASLKHYQKTGLHTTLDEMKNWAQSVRKDRKVEMPACHT
jgi:hypothetical protein